MLKFKETSSLVPTESRKSRSSQILVKLGGGGVQHTLIAVDFCETFVPFPKSNPAEVEKKIHPCNRSWRPIGL
jgi:hypothetical protein